MEVENLSLTGLYLLPHLRVQLVLDVADMEHEHESDSCLFVSCRWKVSINTEMAHLGICSAKSREAFRFSTWTNFLSFLNFCASFFHSFILSLHDFIIDMVGTRKVLFVHKIPLLYCALMVSLGLGTGNMYLYGYA